MDADAHRTDRIPEGVPVLSGGGEPSSAQYEPELHSGGGTESLLGDLWFKTYVAQTVKGVEESFRLGATRVIVAGIKGDIEKGKFTLAEWPQLQDKIQEAVAKGMVKGATWEQIEEQRKDIANIVELVSVAEGTTHVVIASCPALHFDKLDAACGTNGNIHMTFARAGDVNTILDSAATDDGASADRPEANMTPVEPSTPRSTRMASFKDTRVHMKDLVCQYNGEGDFHSVEVVLAGSELTFVLNNGEMLRGDATGCNVQPPKNARAEYPDAFRLDLQDSITGGRRCKKFILAGRPTPESRKSFDAEFASLQWRLGDLGSRSKMTMKKKAAGGAVGLVRGASKAGAQAVSRVSSGDGLGDFHANLEVTRDKASEPPASQTEAEPARPERPRMATQQVLDEMLNGLDELDALDELTGTKGDAV